MSALSYALTDSSTMLRRVLRHTTRNPSTLIMSVLLPGVLLLLLNYGFGGAIATGGVPYLAYLIPGIVMMGACYSVSATAVSVATDASEGIIDRFRTMPVARSALMTGHVIGSVLRSLFGTTLVVLVALALGYRPTTDPLRWLAVLGLVTLLLFAVAWLAAAIGLATGNATGAASAAAIFQILPFLSGAFVPTETMPGWLQTFTANQPMTHIVAALRALLNDTPPGNHAWLAVAWCAGTALLGFLWARRAYNRRAGR
ncbi:ABC transporter permease [Dactylosporangium sp. NPDC005572]|uniref:ABC transporter permease n=1 Tax=Dactylosporangium sp. NPDC005572 TaxID=3156889 RepID=UPI0033BDFE34